MHSIHDRREKLQRIHHSVRVTLGTINIQVMTKILTAQ